jgi:hypothetical protein
VDSLDDADMLQSPNGRIVTTPQCPCIRRVCMIMLGHVHETAQLCHAKGSQLPVLCCTHCCKAVGHRVPNMRELAYN